MKDKIYARMTKAAWRKDRFATGAFIAFVAICVAMISLTAVLFSNLTGAINHLMDTAKTPDFLQMHTGDINIEELEEFVKGRPEVRDYQILRFLNLENSSLTLGDQSLLDSTQDNGISVQGDGFDYMLGLDNELPEVLPGQVYVPVCYEDLYQVKIGADMRIGDRKLKVAGFIRDAQMNSMMASSKRFLVCKEDYERLKQLGSEEYLIEFRFVEGADSNAFKTAYENARLPMNGPAITRPLIKMMNTLSDGIMILIVLVISMLALLISLVCMRFMLLTRVAQEANEVGILKAIGISGKDIRNLFFMRYRWLILAGAGVGIGISVLMCQPMSVQMKKLYGVSENVLQSIMYAALSAVLVGGIIHFFVRKILRKLNEITALSVLSGNTETERKKTGRLCIALVTAIAVFLMMIPSNLYSTLSSPKFVTYMGIGNGEIRMDMRQGENEVLNKIGKLLSADQDVKEYALFQTSLTPVRTEDGTGMNMLMEQGDHTKFPLTYSKGCAPAHEEEVALSFLLSEELGLNPGDKLIVRISGEDRKCTITGIYSDITNGGKTAKLFVKQPDQKENVMWRIAYVTLTEGASRKGFIDRYTAEGAEVTDIASRIKGTYGPTLMQIKRVSVLVKVVSFAIILLVITLFIRMMIASQRNGISIKKAMGFRSMDIRKSFRKSCFPYIFAGIIIGAVSGATLGESICAVALKSLGAEGFRFTLNICSIIFNMILGSIAVIAAVWTGSNGINKIGAVECCRGRE